MISIDEPDVYKLGNTFTIFGELKVVDRQRNQLQEQLRKLQEANPNFANMNLDNTLQNLPNSKDEEEIIGKDNSEKVSNKFNDEDISMVMEQAGCSKDKAIAELEKNNGDVYRGSFLRGRYHGIGRLTRYNGNVQYGMWADGKFVRQLPEPDHSVVPKQSAPASGEDDLLEDFDY